MQRSVGADAAGAGNLTGGRVEGGEGRERQGAFGESVHGAAMPVFAFGFGPVEAAVGSVADAGGDRGIDTGAADLWIEKAADGEGDILDDFAFDADARAASEKAVVLVFGVEFGSDFGGLAVGGGSDDETVDVF